MKQILIRRIKEDELKNYRYPERVRNSWVNTDNLRVYSTAQSALNEAGSAYSYAVDLVIDCRA